MRVAGAPGTSKGGRQTEGVGHEGENGGGVEGVGERGSEDQGGGAAAGHSGDAGVTPTQRVGVEEDHEMVGDGDA